MRSSSAPVRRSLANSQKGLPAIVEQMPPVRDLHCIRKSPGNGVGVTAIAVPGHDLYPGVAVQPGFERGRFAVGQNVDDLPPFQIADQGSIPPTASPGPIINPDHAQLFRGAARSSTHAPKKRILAARKQQPFRQCLGRPTTQHEAEMKHQTLQPGRSSGIGPCNLGR